MSTRTDNPAKDAEGVLAGVHVLDMSRFIAGPFCAQMLGDMGADVIKVERPTGEDARQVEPLYNGESIYMMVYNRNKRAITLNPRFAEGRELLADLISRSDVLVENFRPGTLDQMGFGYDELRKLNPRLVVTSISGFGQTGPFANRALFDAIAQAVSGLMSLTGEAGGEPTLTGTYIADFVAGLHGVIGTMLALYHRERTGLGQVVDLASVDALFTCLGIHPSVTAMVGERPRRTGPRDLLTAPATLFHTTSGYVYVHAGTNALFRRLCEAIGQPALPEDPRFCDVGARMRNVTEVEQIVQSWIGTHSMDEVADALATAGVPFGPVADMADVLTSPQLAAREMVLEIEDSTLGPMVVPGIPIKLSESPGSVRYPPPRLGQHNDEIYQGLLGLTSEELESLRNKGVV